MTSYRRRGQKKKEKGGTKKTRKRVEMRQVKTGKRKEEQGTRGAIRGLGGEDQKSNLGNIIQNAFVLFPNGTFYWFQEHTSKHFKKRFRVFIKHNTYKTSWYSPFPGDFESSQNALFYIILVIPIWEIQPYQMFLLHLPRTRFKFIALFFFITSRIGKFTFSFLELYFIGVLAS